MFCSVPVSSQPTKSGSTTTTTTTTTIYLSIPIWEVSKNYIQWNVSFLLTIGHNPCSRRNVLLSSSLDLQFWILIVDIYWFMRTTTKHKATRDNDSMFTSSDQAGVNQVRSGYGLQWKGRKFISAWLVKTFICGHRIKQTPRKCLSS